MTTFTLLCVPLCLALCAWRSRAIHIQHSLRLDTRARRLFSGQTLPGHTPAEQRGVHNAFESDMRLTSPQLAELLRQQHDGEQMVPSSGKGRRWRRKAVTHQSYLWPDGIVPYLFHHDFPEPYQATVLRAMQFWQQRTCVKFVPMSESLVEYLGHGDHVLFVEGEGCQSSVGRVGLGQQTTEIADYCHQFGSVTHELGHVLGFYHEQSRPDRDDHVIILRHNVLPGRRHNFLKYSHTEIMTEEPYDIGSVMHYGPTYFSEDGHSLTMDTPDESFRAVMGQRDAPSFIDVKTANDMYRCNARCGETTQWCRNMGYIGSHCSCVCPTGLRGDDCSQVLPSSDDCGGVLTSVSGTIHSPGYEHGLDYGNDVDCVWLIQGPYGSRPTTVTVMAEEFEVEDDVLQPCAFDWLEVRSLGPHLHGQRFCGEGPSQPVVYRSSHGHGLLLHFHTDQSFTFGGFTLRYFVQLDSEWE